MPVFESTEKLTSALRLLFGRIGAQVDTAQAIQSARLAIRFNLSQPDAQVLIDGRKKPAAILYGPSPLKPDLEVELSADALHKILLRELRLSKALGSGVMRVRGPVWKTFALEAILHSGQDLYPDVLQELGLTPRRPTAP